MDCKLDKKKLEQIKTSQAEAKFSSCYRKNPEHFKNTNTMPKSKDKIRRKNF